MKADPTREATHLFKGAILARLSGRMPWMALLLGCFGIMPVASGAVFHREILRSGQIFPEAPGLRVQHFLSGNFYALYESINEAGDVLCVVPLEPSDGSPPTHEVQGLVLSTAAGPRLLAKTGDPVPNHILTFENFQDPGLNDEGRVMVRITVPGEVVQQEAILTWRDEQWIVLAKTGQAAPGLPGHEYLSFYPPSLETVMRPDAWLQYPFRGRTVATPGSEWGYWAFLPPETTPRLLCLENGPAPDSDYFNQGETLGFVGSLLTAPGPSTTLLLQGSLGWPSPGVDYTNSQVLWMGTADQLRVRLRTGVPLPPSLANDLGDTVLTAFGVTGINGNGQAVVAANWLGPAGEDILGLLRFDGINWRVVAKKGDPAPGLDGQPEGVFNFFGKTRLNAAGQIIFQGSVNGGPGGLFRWDPVQGLKMLARVGLDWPNLPGRYAPTDFAVNASGQVAVFASNTTLGINRAVFITGADDTLNLVVNKTTDTNPAAGELIAYELPVQWASSSGGQDGRLRVFNNRGEVVYPARFYDADGFSPGPSVLLVSQVAGGNLVGGFLFAGLNRPVSFPVEGPQADLDGITLDTVSGIFGTPVPTIEAPENLAGWTLNVAVVENAVADDRLGLVPGDGVTLEGQEVRINGVTVGSWSRPGDASFQIDFTTEATRERVAIVMASLQFGTGFMDRFGTDATHQELWRRVRLTLTDPMQEETSAERLIEFPFITGLRIAADPPNYGTRTIHLQAELRLSTGVSYIPRSPLPLGSDVLWEITCSYDPVYGWGCGRGSGLDVTAGVYFDEYGTVSSQEWQSEVTVTLAGYEDGGTLFGRKATIVGWRACFLDYFLGCGSSGSAGPGLKTCYDLRFTPLIQPASRLAASAAALSSENLFRTLPLYRTLNHWMDLSPEGRRLASLYYQFSPELITLITDHPELKSLAVEIVADFTPGVAALLAGQGGSFLISQSMIDKLNVWADQVRALASLELAAAIASEKARFNGLQDFAGQSMTGWGQRLGIGSPVEPFLALSSPVRSGNAFRAEANRIENLFYSLWRAIDPAGTWQQVPNARIETSPYSITVTDTNTPPEGSFYRLQGE